MNDFGACQREHRGPVPLAASARLNPAAPRGATPLAERRHRIGNSRKSRPATYFFARSGLPLLGRAALVLFAGEFVHRGYFMISLRAIFQAFWTIHDRERS